MLLQVTDAGDDQAFPFLKDLLSAVVVDSRTSIFLTNCSPLAVLMRGQRLIYFVFGGDLFCGGREGGRSCLVPVLMFWQQSLCLSRSSRSL